MYENLYKNIQPRCSIMEDIYWVLLVAHLIGCSTMFYADTQRSQINDYITNLYNKYFQENVNTFAILALTNYSRLKNKLTRAIMTIYKCHPIITQTADVGLYGYQWLLAIYNKYPIEPLHPYWITSNQLMCCGIEQAGCYLKNIEKYSYVYDDDSMSNTYTFIRKFNMDAFSLSQINLNDVYIDKLLYAKHNNMIVSRVQPNDPIKLNHVDDFNVPSKVQFLSVSVKIGLKKYPIEIDKSWLYVNNELFSKTFLKRYFDYHNIQVHFVNEYVVDIMDNNINMFQLKTGEYIQLNKEDYVIKTTTK